MKIQMAQEGKAGGQIVDSSKGALDASPEYDALALQA